MGHRARRNPSSQSTEHNVSSDPGGDFRLTATTSKNFSDFRPKIALKYNVLCQNGIQIPRHPGQTKVMDVNTPLQLLQSKRSSALIDARKAEAQLTLLNESPDAAGIKTNLLYVVRMFREHIATLDEAIKASPGELR